MKNARYTGCMLNMLQTSGQILPFMNLKVMFPTWVSGIVIGFILCIVHLKVLVTSNEVVAKMPPSLEWCY